MVNTCLLEIKEALTNSHIPFGKDLLEHNLVVFRNGEGALQVLPPLLDVIPEAKLNLIIYYLRQVKHKLFYIIHG